MPVSHFVRRSYLCAPVPCLEFKILSFRWPRPRYWRPKPLRILVTLIGEEAIMSPRWLSEAAPAVPDFCSREGVLALFRLVAANHTDGANLGVIRFSNAKAKNLRLSLSCPREKAQKAHRRSRPTKPYSLSEPLEIEYPDNGRVQRLTPRSYLKFEQLRSTPKSRGRDAHGNNIGPSPFKGIQVWRSHINLSPAANHTLIEVYRVPHPKEGLIGCWFYPLLAPFSTGTGVFLDTGRTWVFRTRREANEAMSALGPQQGDQTWAITARQHGIDTMQILEGPFRMPELLHTADACTSQTSVIGVCPPVKLTAAGGHECRCDDAANVLRCAHRVRHQSPLRDQHSRQSPSVTAARPNS